jgi:two-component system cell cycle response regulator
MGDSVEALFDRTDAALYLAKKNGRNRVVASAA